MKILFGIPDLTHRELANLEIAGIKELIPECSTIHYGPVHSKRGSLNKIIFTFKNAFSIKNALKNNKYDLLFLNTTFDFNALLRDSITSLILKSGSTKIFLKFHGLDPALLYTNRVYKTMLSNWLFNRVHGLGVFSKDEKNAFIGKGISRDKIFVVKNPVNPALYLKDPGFKGKMNLKAQTFIFIFCARFLQFKGLMDVLEAIRIVTSNYQDIHLFCIGDGPEMNKAQLYVNINDLNSFVTFTGFIAESETRYYYSNADTLVFPSSHEGFPMVVFQSLAAGVPIITTRISASADYLTEPDNVLWVEYNNPAQIADSMITLLNDKDMVDRMKRNNISKAYQFTTDKNAREYLNIFETLIINQVTL
jgi:glycosyltransferase involved in cell wall biosynthesis